MKTLVAIKRLFPQRYALLGLGLLLATACRRTDPDPVPSVITSRTVVVDCAQATIGTSTTWADVESDPSKVDYLVKCRIRVTGGVLTVAPGVRVQFEGAEAGLQATGTGALVINGSAAAPIVLEGRAATAGSWRGVYVNSAGNQLQYVRINHAGNANQSFQTTDAVGEAAVVMDGGTLFVDDLTVENSTRHGISLAGGSLLKFSTVTVRNCANAPLVTTFALATKMGLGLRFEANGTNAVVLAPFNTAVGVFTLNEAATLANPGVPYHAQRTLRVIGPGSALTVAAGTSVRFALGTGLEIGADAALAVPGTAAAPVTLTALNGTAGGWAGLSVKADDARNVMTNCVVEYGGGAVRTVGNNTQVRGNIVLENVAGSGLRPRLTITGSTVRNSQGYGIAWNPAGTLVQSGNTFAANPLGDVVSLP